MLYNIVLFNLKLLGMATRNYDEIKDTLCRNNNFLNISFLKTCSDRHKHVNINAHNILWTIPYLIFRYHKKYIALSAIFPRQSAMTDYPDCANRFSTQIACSWLSFQVKLPRSLHHVNTSSVLLLLSKKEQKETNFNKVIKYWSLNLNNVIVKKWTLRKRSLWKPLTYPLLTCLWHREGMF